MWSETADAREARGIESGTSVRARAHETERPHCHTTAESLATPKPPAQGRTGPYAGGCVGSAEEDAVVGGIIFASVCEFAHAMRRSSGHVAL